MSLVNRTGESTPLSIHGGEPLVVDADFDSSLDPTHRVVVYSNADDQDFYFYMTYDEARQVRDRLSLITGDSEVDTTQ